MVCLEAKGKKCQGKGILNSLDCSCTIKTLLGEDELHLATRLNDQAEWPYVVATFPFSSIQLPICVTLDRGSLFFDQKLLYLDLGTSVLELQLHTRTTLSRSRAGDVCVMTSESMDDPGRPPGIVVSAATSFWIPIQPKQVFGFLWDENFMSEWDVLSNGRLVKEMARVTNGRD
ncbi:hypothetical protein Tco_0868174 [Tanacetum coccineum]